MSKKVFKVIEISTCDDCPHNGSCNAWKNLTSSQRFTLKTGVGVGGFILKTCHLKEYARVDREVVDLLKCVSNELTSAYGELERSGNFDHDYQTLGEIADVVKESLPPIDTMPKVKRNKKIT